MSDESPRPAFEVVPEQDRPATLSLDTDEPPKPARRLPWLAILLTFVSVASVGASAALAVRLSEAQREALEANLRTAEAYQRAADAEREREAQAKRIEEAMLGVRRPIKAEGANSAPDDKRADRDKDEAEREVKWAKLGQWSQAGDVRVRFVKAGVLNPPLMDSLRDKKWTGKDRELLVWAEIQNTSAVKKIGYSRWSQIWSDSSRNLLTDNHNNKYSFIDHSFIVSAQVEGGLPYSSHTMRPGDEPITDVLCFERPVDAASELSFTLCALPFEEKGLAPFRFKLGASDWAPRK